MTAASDTVLVIDLGAQYANVIARRVRERHVYSEIVPSDIGAGDVRARRPAGIILSGGPASVYADDAVRIDPDILDAGIPVLGICYGHQLLAQELGGEVTRTDRGEYGRTALTAQPDSVLLRGQPTDQTVWMSHRDAVTRAPDGFRVIACTGDNPVAAIEDPQRALFGVQYHPEVSHTPLGGVVLDTFLSQIGARRTWTAHSVIEQQVAAIRDQVGGASLVCGLSGGVDSAVAAALVAEAVGDQLTCVFVDHGLLRHDERRLVEDAFGAYSDSRLVVVKAQDRFLERLAGVTDPETKRKRIGTEFIRVFEDAAREHAGDARFLVQGTLYPDVIESGHGTASTIKSHHNVGGLPDDMAFELVEPLRWLFKDEVRRVGEELGLPPEIVWRQPFPGPGLAVRIIGEVTAERLALVRAADHIVLEELRRAGLDRAATAAGAGERQRAGGRGPDGAGERQRAGGRGPDGAGERQRAGGRGPDVADAYVDHVWQSFAVLPDVRAVGVQGDERTYGYPVIVRAVTSEDAMTADFARLDWDVLERIANRIVGEVDEVNRVAYDITSKPPGTIEWE